MNFIQYSLKSGCLGYKINEGEWLSKQCFKNQDIGCSMNCAKFKLNCAIGETDNVELDCTENRTRYFLETISFQE